MEVMVVVLVVMMLLMVDDSVDRYDVVDTVMVLSVGGRAK